MHPCLRVVFYYSTNSEKWVLFCYTIYMYHAPSRKVQLFKRFVTVIISATIVIAGVSILTAITLGYRFNRENGHIERGGILQLSSKPTGANITVNGQPHPTTTSAKIVSDPGDYALQLERDGYRTWQKTVPIQAGNITWVMYPRLIPQKLPVTNVAELPATLAGALPSGSSKRYAFLQKADTPTISTANLDSEEVKLTSSSIPADVYTQPTAEAPKNVFSLKLWSGDERSMLVRHVFADNQEEWLLVYPEKPEDSINLTKLFGVQLKDVVFGSHNGSRMYALVDGAVRLLDVGNGTISRPLVEKVHDYTLFEDYILFVSQPTEQKTQQVGYTHKDFTQPRVVEAVPYDGEHAAKFDIGKYYDNYYFLITQGKQATLSRSSNLPTNPTAELERKKVKSFELEKPVTTAHITDNGQFATIQDGWSFATFNLEVQQLATTDFQPESAQKAQKLRYLDRYLLWAERDGNLRTFEFDGANQHNIMPVEPQFDATLSPSGKYLYGVRKTDKGYTLSRVQLLDITP